MLSIKPSWEDSRIEGGGRISILHPHFPLPHSHTHSPAPLTYTHTDQTVTSPRARLFPEVPRTGQYSKCPRISLCWWTGEVNEHLTSEVLQAWDSHCEGHPRQTRNCFKHIAPNVKQIQGLNSLEAVGALGFPDLAKLESYMIYWNTRIFCFYCTEAPSPVICFTHFPHWKMKHRN